MEGFKSNPKMRSDIACFKEGGSVYKARTHKEDPKEAAEDKAMVKKGIRQHEAAKHKGEEKTEIALKKGGRCKKEGGNVRKYKTGGAVAMKKDKEDKKGIAQTKKTKAGKADTPSAATGKKKESPKTDNKAAKKTMTASMVGSLPEAPEAPSAAMSMPEGQPIEMMADGGMPGASVMNAMPRRRRGIPEGLEFGALGQGALQQGVGQSAGMAGGMGTAASAGPMGNAAPRGVVTDEERDLLKGLQAVGRYANGGGC